MTIYQNTIAGSGFLQGPTGATGPAANTNITVYEYVATAGQTTFTGVDANLNTLAYTPTGIFVTLNGSVLNNILDYTATNGTDIVLTQAAAVNDELNIYVFPAFNVANTYTQAETNSLLNTKLNVTGGTITGNVIMSANGYFQVPIGTTEQRPATTTPGFIRYNTDLNSLESANGTAWANVGSGATSSGGGGVAWTPAIQNTNFIAVKNSGYLVNTYTGNVTVTLPSAPTFGDNITFVDYGNAFSSNVLIIYPNGNKIAGNTSNIALTVNGQSTSLVYTDANKGWVNYSSGSAVGTYLIEYLLVAGGGGGGSGYESGGGGAGGLITATTNVSPGTTYAITVGGGGAGYPAYSGGWQNAKATSGTNSAVLSLATALGGGGGAQCDAGSGLSGGSGGGGARSGVGGTGTSGQGNPGGTSALGAAPNYGGGGGGGAGGAGTNGSSTSGGNGGAGVSSSISGSSVTYAGGGGGGVYANPGPGGTGGSGGSGGGGPGGANNNSAGSSASNNTGSGGGAGGGNDTPSSIGRGGGNGGSGIVIIRYFGPQRASGGAILQSGGYTIHTFTTSGTFVA